MTFDGLIGQDVVAETIINSIKADKIPNAYLFTGIRGVGKTSIARIVAKALNCSNGIDNLCKENLCENCLSITNSSHIDVMELNGADKTSISDIDFILEEQPDVIIFGTGKNSVTPNRNLVFDLAKKNIGIEAMTTIAASKTYNILISEGRDPVAILLIE